MSHSPISDAGYGSEGGSPWLPQPSGFFSEKEALSKLGHERSGTTGATGVQPGLSAANPTSDDREPQPLLGRRNARGPSISIYAADIRAASFFQSSPYWLTLYFFFNLSLTLYNKIALVSFPFPWSLTCIHSLCATIGSYAAYRRGYFKRTAALTAKDQAILVAYSSLYTINIAVSNLSLNLVSVALHQVIRSTTPIFTIIISIALFSKQYQLRTYLALVPVILGVCLATYGDYACTMWGLCLTLIGALLAAVKGISTNKLLVGQLKMHPLDLLLRMSPLAFGQCLIFAYLSGETSQIYERTFVTATLTRSQWYSLAMNGALAFGLNVVSFTANKKTGPLTMSVAANVKQVLTIVLAVMIFNLTINGLNLLGITSTIAGGAYYSYVEYTNKQQQQQAVQHPAMLSVRADDGSSDPLLPVFSPALPSPTAVMSEKAPLSPLPHAERLGQPVDRSWSTGQEKETYLASTGATTGLGLL